MRQGIPKSQAFVVCSAVRRWQEEARRLQALLAAAPGATTMPHVIGRSRCGMGGPQQGCGAYTSLNCSPPGTVHI